MHRELHSLNVGKSSSLFACRECLCVCVCGMFMFLLLGVSCDFCMSQFDCSLLS